ncbi:hypothetical protein KP509_20G072300 [Ceratopteris richardii]|uniref:SKP1-like protein n=1 Tax=Ceratopteris richardii TaxID=49495 RepID=A0A8T2SH07_CERRI|nr:hypothetical protein KP509_20G072300 [Ceratopteris richardii]
MSTELKVKLKSADGELFEVEEIVAFESETIKDIVEDTGTDSVIPLFNVSAKILSKVIKYCRFHALEQQIIAANYLNIQALLDLTCQCVADMIKGKSPEELRKIFNLENDFTPEEEEEVRRENQWAFEST